MHVINAVFKRNFLSYFSGVIGYLFIVAFVGVESYFAFQPDFFADNLANLDQLNAKFPILLLFIVPAITMNVWSEERKLGTDELLFTLPASDLEVLLGKYAAVVGVYLVALFFSLSHVIVLMCLGSPDKGLLFATYFGYALSGCALLGAGMLASVLTSSAAVAYVVGALICAIPVFIDRLSPGNRLFQGLSVGEQLRDFTLGMIPIAGLFYFISLTALFLYLNLVFISRRHWSGGPHQTPMWAHFLIRAVALGAILISANVVAAGASRRLDLTTEKLYSLSKTTKDVINNLKSDRPVLIQAFISREVPHELVSVRSTLIGLLRQYDQAGGNRLRVSIKNTEKFSDAAEEAKRYGIESQEVQSERAGRAVRDDVFLGVVVTSVDEQVVVPFFDKGTPVEYELTRSIRTVSEPKRKSVGILRTDAQVSGGFDMQNFRQLPEWRVAIELKKQYEVKAVGPDELAHSNVDVLLAVMPSSLTDPEVMNLIDYLQRGKPTLIVDDPFPVFQPGVSPRQPKPRPGGPMGMMGGGGPQQEKADRGNATKLTRALGIFWNSGQTVWDSYDPHPNIREQLAGLADIVYISKGSKAPKAFDPASPVTRDLQELMMFYPGSISPDNKEGFKFEPLVESGPDSVTYDWDDYVSSGGFFGGMQLIDPTEKGISRDQKSRVIAARITGHASKNGDQGSDDAKDAIDSKSADIHVIFVAEMDMISNPFFYVRDKELLNLKLDNVNFILNAVDDLAGDESLITLRSRQAAHRTLTTIEASTKALVSRKEDEASKAGKDAKKAFDDASAKLQEEVDKIAADKSLDPRAKQVVMSTAAKNKQKELDAEKERIESKKKRQIKEAEVRAEREIRTIEGSARWMAIILPPIPAMILGIFVLATRIKDERQGIIPDRLVSRK
jgi:ABC-2 type transport system permease protein